MCRRGDVVGTLWYLVLAETGSICLKKCIESDGMDEWGLRDYSGLRDLLCSRW